MPITYNNPDEVVKVKHILSLAEHIAEKIDGSGSSSSSSSSIMPQATPTLTASKTTYSLTEFSGDTIKEAGICDLTYNGDGALFIDKAAIDAGLGFTIERPQAKYYLSPRYKTAPTVPLTFTVGFTETANYKACSVEITITA